MKKITIGFLMLAGCVSADPPAVHAPSSTNANAPNTSAASPPLGAGLARVVLIRPESQCDSSAYPIIVDENGHFVGEISQNSQASIDVPPGEHTLFAWPSVDARVEKYPSFDPVGVVNLNLKAGDTRYVEVVIPQRLAAQCWHITTFSLRHLRADDADLKGWLATTKQITVDRAVGEAELARDPAVVQTHLASGRRELEHGRALRDERAEAQHPPGAPPAATDSADTR